MIRGYVGKPAVAPKQLQAISLTPEQVAEIRARLQSWHWSRVPVGSGQSLAAAFSEVTGEDVATPPTLT